MNQRLEKAVLKYSQDLLQILKEGYGARLQSVILFGSAVTGKLRKGSDLDYLIVLTEVPSSYGKRAREILPLLHQSMKAKSYQKLAELESSLSPMPLILSKSEVRKHPAILLDMTLYCKVLFDRGNFFQKELITVKKRLQELGSQRIRLPDGTYYWKLKPSVRLGEEIQI
jgi:predicted nucleotidyltransferase